MNILGGLDRPSAGQVWVGGNDLLKLSDPALNRYRRDQVGFVWQQRDRNLVAYLNAQENVALPMILAARLANHPPAGDGSRQSGILSIALSPLAPSTPAPPGRPGRLSMQGSASAVITPTWPSPSAAV
jgi:ABC-type sulfate/molybdate transport systems ATPase subunit